ncbi:MAG: histidine phosphatase family protein [Rhizobiaceae bacterium]
MPVLFLLRHAKSSWDDPALDDFDRPLAPRGLKAAPTMGREMASRGWVPDLALVSPAARAAQSWALVSAAFADVPPTQFEENLYMATPQTMLGFVTGLDEAAEGIVLVGHNPGMEELALLLAGPGSDETAEARMAAKFPTAALARLAFDGPWVSLAPQAAQLTHFIRPRDLPTGRA